MTVALLAKRFIVEFLISAARSGERGKWSLLLIAVVARFEPQLQADISLESTVASNDPRDCLCQQGGHP